MTSTCLDSRTIENFILIWLDSKTNHEQNSLIDYFQELINSIYLFNDCDQCLDFTSDIKTEKIFLIISDIFARQILPAIEYLHQVDSIYIFAKKRDETEKWTKKIPKIKGVFTQIHPIYDAFRRDLRQCDDDLSPISILPLNDIEKKDFHSIFLYRQLITEILFDQNYPTHSKLDFVEFCQSKYSENGYQLKLIEEFHRDYQSSAAIRWFTRDCFLSAMLNKALLIGDIDIILKMDFFIRDLHQHIQRLHKQTRLTVYRGQGITEDVYQKILDNQNGYLSFNNFFIATTDKEVSFNYAHAALQYHQLVGVLFHIEIDGPNGSFTSLDKVGYHQGTNDQYLFTINTIFRIDNVEQISDSINKIKLRSTYKEDNEIKCIKKMIGQNLEEKNAQEQIELLVAMSKKIDGLENIEDNFLEKKETDQISTQQNMNECPNEKSETSLSVTCNQ